MSDRVRRISSDLLDVWCEDLKEVVIMEMGVIELELPAQKSRAISHGFLWQN